MSKEDELGPCMWFSCSDTLELANTLKSFVGVGWKLTDLQVYNDELKPYLVTMRPEDQSCQP